MRLFMTIEKRTLLENFGLMGVEFHHESCNLAQLCWRCGCHLALLDRCEYQFYLVLPHYIFRARDAAVT